MIKMNELKKCPFCGGEAVVYVNNGVCVICVKCGAHSKCLVDGYSQGKPHGGAVNKVIKAWNNRQQAQQIINKLEDYREEAEQRGAAGMLADIIEAVKEELE